MNNSIIMIGDRNKKGRYNKWLEEVKDTANKYKITLDQMIEIIDMEGIKSIRELLSSVESEEFISYYLYKNKR